MHAGDGVLELGPQVGDVAGDGGEAFLDELREIVEGRLSRRDVERAYKKRRRRAEITDFGC